MRVVKVELQCDVCGKTGKDSEISTDLDDIDRCSQCAISAKLLYLKRKYACKKEWLDSTHMKDLRELEKQITDLER